MQTFQPMLAEVADKEPGLLLVWSIAAGVSIACFALSRWRRWALVLTVPVAACCVYATFQWLHDPHEGPAIVRELGRGYVTQAWIAGFAPFLLTTAGSLRPRRCHDPA